MYVATKEFNFAGILQLEGSEVKEVTQRLIDLGLVTEKPNPKKTSKPSKKTPAKQLLIETPSPVKVTTSKD